MLSVTTDPTDPDVVGDCRRRRSVSYSFLYVRWVPVVSHSPFRISAPDTGDVSQHGPPHVAESRQPFTSKTLHEGKASHLA